MGRELVEERAHGLRQVSVSEGSARIWEGSARTEPLPKRLIARSTIIRRELGRLTGRIVSSIEEAVQAIPELLALDRNAVRTRFEQRFSSRRMASDYVKIYHAILRRHTAPEIQLPPVAALSAATAGARAHRSKTGMRNEPFAE